jgi:hypothetical protein
VLAAGAAGTIALLATMRPEFNALHVVLFVAAMAAFASNLTETLHPLLRALAALVQAVCLFEGFGFCVGLTTVAVTGRQDWSSPVWWNLALACGMLGACLGALASSASRVIRRVVLSNQE